MILSLFDFEDEVTITTERLALRLLDLDDAEDVFEIRGDIDTTSDAGVPCMKSLEDPRTISANGEKIALPSFSTMRSSD